MKLDIAIQNWDHFFLLAKDFNRRFKTKTYLIYDTIDNIAKKYNLIDYNNMHFYWKEQVDSAFTKSNRFSSNKIDWNPDFYWLNNLVSFKKSFEQCGFTVLNPVCLHYTTKKHFVHPGQFRFHLLYKTYKKKIPLIITDYTKSLPSLGIAKYNFNSKYHYYREVANHWLDKHNQYDFYQEVYSTDQNLLDNSFGKLEKLNEIRTFEKKGNNIYCNETLIMHCINGIWMPYLGDHY